MTAPTILWLRQDLRLADHPALTAALESGGPVIPVFVWAPQEEGDWAPGGASRWWLHESLQALAARLGSRGSRLVLRRAGPGCDDPDTLAALRRLVADTGAGGVLWSRRYEPAVIERDRRIKEALRADGLDARSFNAALLVEPWDVRNQSGRPFQVFTPYWRHVSARLQLPAPAPAPATLPAPARWPASLAPDDLGLLPRIRWYEGIAAAWQPGEDGAARHLEAFLGDAADGYAEGRNLPAIRGTSRLSPHLHFGELSPRQVWHAAARWRDSTFMAEIGWREFAHHLLFHFPHTSDQPLRAEYAKFPWARDEGGVLRAWQRGRTGIPLVDAGMRELWETGWMHNRVRMVVGSFLVKNLRLHWLEGARWFWDTLVDADLASNTLGWQWSAGCGADAAPYFRVFNPVSQGEKFDADGAYVRRWVPELARLPGAAIHAPWTCRPVELAAAGVTLGRTYPQPVVDLKASREAALAAWKSLRAS
jgi:deoxyribodipyrimidine photo-lyase